MRKPLPAIDAIRLRASHRWLTYVSTGLLVATGIAWLALDVVSRGRADPVGPHPLLHPLLAAHGAIAFVALMAYGGIVVAHVPRAWAIERNRWTGCLVAAVLTILGVTAWLLYYAGSESIHEIAGMCHWILGFSVALLLPLHVAMGRRARRVAAPAAAFFPTD